MRAVLLATLPLAALACSHATPAPPAAQAAVAAAPDAGVGLRYPVARTVDVVDDYHGTKVAGPAPVLIRIETRAGHSVGKPTLKKIQEGTDLLAFIEWALKTPGSR